MTVLIDMWKIVGNQNKTSRYFQPTSCDKRPNEQYYEERKMLESKRLTLRRGFKHNTRIATGTTFRFCLSYGDGTPSKSFKRSKASLPRCNLWGNIPTNFLCINQKKRNAENLSSHENVDSDKFDDQMEVGTSAQAESEIHYDNEFAATVVDALNQTILIEKSTQNDI
uniref:Uncharacterized protein n=1 Tax=Romanomermis culicivorax TaxID=13658 RepID=A0A915L7W3_ROMCU